jgi:hypothetical protein
MARPAQPFGGHPGGFARPTLNPSRPTLLARPNVGWSHSLTGRRPGGWAPPAANRGWARPAANLATRRRTTANRGNTTSNDRRPYHGRGYHGWHHYRPRYGWGSYSSYDSYSSNYYPYDSYSPSYSDYYSYGSYPSGDSDVSSGSLIDSGASSSSYPSASSSSESSDEGAAKTDKETAVAERRMDQAVRAFRKGDYADAQWYCERAIRHLPGDANLQEFRALCQFAQGKYKDAAGTLYDVLAAGPGWDWETISSFYASARTYTRQLRALERYVRENPRDAPERFVLAYHYLALGARDGAAGQLRKIVKLQPKDQVSPTILEALKKVKDDEDRTPARRPAPGR